MVKLTDWPPRLVCWVAILSTALWSFDDVVFAVIFHNLFFKLLSGIILRNFRKNHFSPLKKSKYFTIQFTNFTPFIEI